MMRCNNSLSCDYAGAFVVCTTWRRSALRTVPHYRGAMCTASALPSDRNAESNAVSPYAKKRAETMVLFHRLKTLSQDDPARERLRTELIEDHMPYARHIALRYGGRGELTEDFVQVAYLALVKAVDNFDPDRGTGFLGYATPVILGEIKKYFRDATWDLHVPRAMQELTQAVRTAADHFTRERSRSPTVAELAGKLGVTSELVAEALVAAGVYSVTSLDRPARGEPAQPSLVEFIGVEVPEARVSDRPYCGQTADRVAR
jgi:RNA polymerase sigma-B factor